MTTFLTLFPDILVSEAEVEILSSDLDVVMEVEISEEHPESEGEEEIHNPEMINIGAQVSMPSLGSMTLQQFENNPKAVNYYTGFRDIAHFRFFFDCLGRAAFFLQYKSRTLPEEDELFLTLMKLRQNKGKQTLNKLCTRIQYSLSKSRQ